MDVINMTLARPWPACIREFIVYSAVHCDAIVLLDMQ